MWYVIQRETNGKVYTIAARINHNTNLVAFIRDYPGIVVMKLCETKKEAYRIAEAWNKSHA